MRKSITETAKPSSTTYEALEEMVGSKVQEYVQEILEEEIEIFFREEEIRKNRGIMCARIPEWLWKDEAVYGDERNDQYSSSTCIRGTEEKFESKIIPFFKRRSKEVGQLLPELYLHGLAQGDFEMALRGLLGEGAPLSAWWTGRLKAKWQIDYEEWKRQDISWLEVVYQWADGIYVKARLEKDKAALLVIIGGLTNGRKVLLACREWL